MARVKNSEPRKNYVPPAILQHNRARRTRRLYRELSLLFESLSIPVRIRFVHRHRSNPMQRLDRVGGFRIYGPNGLPPVSPPTPPMESNDEVLSEDPLPSSDNSPVIPYPREMFPSFSPPIFPSNFDDKPER